VVQNILMKKVYCHLWLTRPSIVESLTTLII
jgi:hypothetical protein